MTELHDLILARPLGQTWIRWVLFFGFVLHLAFVLLMLGSAILGLTHLVRAWVTGARRHWEDSGDFLKPFFVFKSVAIVLGIAPLLLIQVGYTIPFMTAGNLWAPLWMGIIALLIVALFCLEYCIERPGRRTLGMLVTAGCGAFCLLGVAGVFALVLVTTENPQWWDYIGRRDGQLPVAGSIHWAARLLHVYGAAVVVASVFHLAQARPEAVSRREVLGHWLMGGVLFQFVGGIALYASLRRPAGGLVTTLVVLGALAAAALLWRGQTRGFCAALWRTRTILGLTGLLLMVMLLVRQLLQERVLFPMSAHLAANAAVYQERLRAMPSPAASGWEPSANVVARAEPAVLYLESCGFCHGGVADGSGTEAARLKVPPADLNVLRLAPPELRRILLEGIPGTAMPRFGFHTRDELAGLGEFLLDHTGLRPELEPFAPPADEEAAVTAAHVFESRCRVCHGADGRGGDIARTFEPPVPDFTRISFSPVRISEVVARGYPGTMMPAFESLPAAVRLHLAQRVRGFFQAEAAAR